MVFIDRDVDNKVIAVYARPQKDNHESILDDDPDVLAFLNPPETYVEKRLKSIADGGYGSINEQLEMMNEQGFAAWQAHCATVKTNNPKP